MGKVLIIECVPRVDRADEMMVLQKFLQMTVPIKVHQIRRSSKEELVKYLANKRDLSDFQFVHLSGHGDGKFAFRTPKGSLYPEEFPKDCFLKKTVTISACALGNKDFITRFMSQTSAKRAIAPLKDVDFIDAALWFVCFYYHALHLGNKPKLAFNKTREALSHVKGAFSFWEER